MKVHGTNPTVDKETNEARIMAHQWFDPLWHFGLLTRNEAYVALANEMGIPLKECHISIFTKEQCWAVRELVGRIRKRMP